MKRIFHVEREDNSLCVWIHSVSDYSFQVNYIVLVVMVKVVVVIPLVLCMLSPHLNHRTQTIYMSFFSFHHIVHNHGNRNNSFFIILYRKGYVGQQDSIPECARTRLMKIYSKQIERTNEVEEMTLHTNQWLASD